MCDSHMLMCTLFFSRNRTCVLAVVAAFWWLLSEMDCLPTFTEWSSMNRAFKAEEALEQCLLRCCEIDRNRCASGKPRSKDWQLTELTSETAEERDAFSMLYSGWNTTALPVGV